MRTSTTLWTPRRAKPGKKTTRRAKANQPPSQIGCESEKLDVQLWKRLVYSRSRIGRYTMQGQSRRSLKLIKHEREITNQERLISKSFAPSIVRRQGHSSWKIEASRFEKEKLTSREDSRTNRLTTELVPFPVPLVNLLVGLIQKQDRRSVDGHVVD